MSEVTIQNTPTPLTMFGKYRDQECTEEMILNDQNYFRFHKFSVVFSFSCHCLRADG